MFELRRGDQDALEGRVIVYAENLLPMRETERYVFIYASTSPSDLYLYEGSLNPSEINEIETNWQQTRKNLQAKSNESSEAYIPFATRIMSLEDEEDLFEIPGDVVYAGKAADREIMMALLQSMVTVYIINYNNQNSTISRSEGNADDRCADESEPEMRAQAESVSRLTGQLCHAIEVDNDGERDAAIQELRRIGAISKCSSEISNIVGIAQTQHPEKITLIDLYIRMIAAIQAEEYRRAVEIKREIQATAS